MFRPKYHPELPKQFERLAWSAVGLVALASLLGFLGRLHWSLDLLSHFRVQYFQIALILGGVCLWVRRNKCATALIAIAAFNYAFILPLYFGKPAPATEKPLRAMLMNINAGNGNTELVLEAIRRSNPDLLLLEEVTPEWADQLVALSETYPYCVAEPQEGCFGIMLVGKYPFERTEVAQIGPAGIPSIIAEVRFPQGVVSVVGTHPLPPVGAERSMLRNIQLKELSKYAFGHDHPVLLLGDLNTSPWSPHFRDLIRESGLRNSMEGFGFQPSWPSGIPFLKIPIDHVLHSPGIAVHNRMVGGDVGSDHLPVIVDFSIR